MAVISSNEIVVGYKVVGQAELQQLAAQFEKISKAQEESLEEFRKVNNKVKETTDSLKENAKAGKKAGDETSKAFKDTEQSATKLSNTLKGIGGLIAGAFTLAALKSFGQQVIETSAMMEALRKSISFTAGSAKDGADTFAFLTSLSEKLGISVINLANSFKGFSSAAKTAGISSLRTEEIFTSVAKAVAVMGLTSEQSERTLKALEQMISKGTVSSEELRQQLGDALPGAFQLFAAATGKTTQELQKMLQNGEVLAVTTLPKFAKQLEKVYGPEVAKGINTINAEQSRLSSQWTLFLESVGEKLGPAYKIGLQNTALFLKGLRGLIQSEESKVKENAAKTKQETYELILEKAKEMSDGELEIARLNAARNLTIEQKKQEEFQRIFEAEKRKREELNKLRAQTQQIQQGPNNDEKKAKESLDFQRQYVAELEGELKAVSAIAKERMDLKKD